MLIMLCFVLEIGNLWYARVQVETSLEAAALAAVRKWGDDPSLATTETPRCYGVEYAYVNPAGGQAVEITSNFDTSATPAPNENASADGNLIFGAITPTEPPWVFDANSEPSCGIGSVLFDASGGGNLGSARNEWGISYQRTEPGVMPAIRSIEIDLLPGTPMYFDSNSYNSGEGETPAVSTVGGYSQPNFFGLTTSEISHVFSEPAAYPDRFKKLTFYFPDSGATAATFAPCERFRFGVDVSRDKDDKNFNGDDIGQYGVKVTVTFDDGNTATGNFVDTRSNDSPCDYVGTNPDCPNSGIIVNSIPDLPCPPVSGGGNNPDGQSYVQLGGSGGGGKFGVRAQAEVPVPSLCGSLFGITLPVFSVRAATTAMYDCSVPDNPRLIRVLPENYFPP